MQDLSTSLFQSDTWLDMELSEDDFLKNAIAMSLFSDARAEELPSHETSHRGYWADSLEPKESPLGSRLWILAQSGVNDETLEDAIQYASESLSWLKAQELVTNIQVDGEIAKAQLTLFIRVTTPKNTYRFSVDPKNGDLNAIF